MCMYSLHAHPTEMVKAQIGQTLTRGEYRAHDAFMTDEGKLACIKHGSELMIDDMQFGHGTARWVIDTYAGKSMTVTFVDGTRSGGYRRRRGYAADCIQLPNLTDMEGEFVRLPFHLLAWGTTCVRKRKVRKDAGITRPRNLNKVLGLDQIRADLPPDPKPEGAETPAPAEPAPEPVQEPAKEPAEQTS